MALLVYCRASVNDALLTRVDVSSDVPCNGGVTSISVPGTPSRSQSVKQKLNVSRDSLNSDSGDSDTTNNRRSGDRHEVWE